MVTMNFETSVKAFPNAQNSPPSPESKPLTNPVITVLMQKGNALKNFGQCIIFMLNRERTCAVYYSDDRGNISATTNSEITVPDIHNTRDIRVFLQQRSSSPRRRLHS